MSIEPTLTRLRNQKLVRSEFRSASDVVAWLGAVQAQDFAGAKWAVGLRARGLTEGTVERAFTEGAIIRTHVLRPTWHFLAPADIRWMLALTAPRVNAVSAYYYRQCGLDGKVFARSRTLLERALRGGKQQTRTELARVFQKAGIQSAGVPLALLMMRAELDGIVCSGARRGRQFTYALLEERVPPVRQFTRDEALTELASRYFSSHGPATLRDYVWWSGLTVRDAKAGIEGAALVRDVRDGLTCWSAPERTTGRQASAPRSTSPSVLLLPNYDEYLVAYKDRGAVRDAFGPPEPHTPTAFPHTLVIDGKVRGRWCRGLHAKRTTIEVWPSRRLTSDEAGAAEVQAERYQIFTGIPTTLSWRRR